LKGTVAFFDRVVRGISSSVTMRSDSGGEFIERGSDAEIVISGVGAELVVPRRRFCMNA